MPLHKLRDDVLKVGEFTVTCCLDILSISQTSWDPYHHNAQDLSDTARFLSHICLYMLRLLPQTEWTGITYGEQSLEPSKIYPDVSL